MLFIGDDWAEDHHDVELVDDEGQVMARRRLPEGIEGIAGLHALVADHLPEDWAELEPEQVQGLVKVGIETDRGPWVAALVAAGYEVFAINPLSVARYRQRHSTSGAKSDAADAHLLAEIIRVDRAHHRPLAGDSEEAEAIKLVARTHQSLIWERSRHVLRLRSALREFFPAALEAFADLDAPDALELLALAPEPDRARQLTRRRITAALRRANRRNVDARVNEIQQILGAEQLHRSTPVQSAYAAIVAGQAAIVATLNAQIDQMAAVVDAHFGQHPDAEIYTSQPGLGVVLAARVLGEFGDDPHRYTDAKARKNYAGTAPITKASGKKKIVLARYARNRRLGDALQQWAFCSLRGSSGARVYYQQLRARGTGHQAALRQLANRLVGILHGCLKTHTTYDEHTAWSHHLTSAA
ncbi:IS110 family RNA-guided transposase [Nocardioides ungokensis]|uniref:IS110 family transposase n=1 Tax=Nocardioides ungokensis TaxID=1643322 RepID=UPI0015DF9CF7|nr:IS110 family transposase [Nocardioides ungokensis]